MTLGNLIEAAEMGTDILLMPGGSGICRLGYYAKIQQQILHDLGYGTKIIQLGVSQHKLWGLLKILKNLSNNTPWIKIISAFRFGMAKLNALDEIERLVQKVRAVEMVKGTANRLFTRAIEAIDQADDYDTLRDVKTDYIDQLNQVPRDCQTQHPTSSEISVVMAGSQWGKRCFTLKNTTA